MLIGSDKLFIQYYFPLLMGKFPLAVGHELRVNLVFAKMLGCKVFEAVRKLQEVLES